MPIKKEMMVEMVWVRFIRFQLRTFLLKPETKNLKT